MTAAGRAAGAVQVPGVPQDGATALALAGTQRRSQRCEKPNARGNCGTHFMDSSVCIGCALDR